MKKLLTILVTVFTAGTLCAAVTKTVKAPVIKNKLELTKAKPETELVWQESLDRAMDMAVAEYKPVFVLFTSPDCPWCYKLKTSVLKDFAIVSLLQEFVLVEVDVSRNRETAALYQVSGVPAIIVLSSDGRIRNGISGYAAVPILKDMLEGVLNPAFTRKHDAEYLKLIGFLESGEVPKDKWIDILACMGDSSRRKEVHEKIFSLDSFPHEEMVRLLSNRRIAIRLGALEILEEKTGETFGFDPWLDDENIEKNKDAIARFAEREAEVTNSVSMRYSSLTEKQLRSYVRDLISDDRQRSVRSMRMLEQGGGEMARHLASYLEENPSLPEGVRKRIKEVQYAILVPAMMGLEPSVFAHRLVYGTLDTRLKCISALRTMGRRAVLILPDFLAEEDPIVRETAADVLTSIGGKRVVTLLQQHLKTEKEDEVVFAILRGLGKVRSRLGLSILTEHLGHSNEDLVIASLNSIAQLKTKLAADDIIKCLSDSRWRVRVAALDAAGKLKLNETKEKVAEMLDDRDDFVRFSAVKALVQISAGKSELAKLEEAFLREDILKGPVAAAFGSLDKPLPASFEKSLENKSPEVLLAVIEAFADCGDSGLELGAKYIDHDNLDVSCAAIRLIASRGMGRSQYQNVILKVLKSDVREKVLAALESIDISSRNSIISRLGLPVVNLELPVIKLDDDSEGTDDSSSGIDDLFSAFDEEEKQEPDVPEPVDQADAVDLNALFEDFGDDGESYGTTDAVEAQSSGSTGMIGLKKEIERYMNSAEDKEISFAAGLVLSKLGDKAALPFLSETMEDRTVTERIAVAGSLESLKGDASVEILVKLLNDASESVRSAAVSSILGIADKSTEVLDVLFKELEKDDRRLKVFDLFGNYRLSNLARSKPSVKRSFRKWAAKLLEDKDDVARQNFGIYLRMLAWKRGDEELIAPFLKSQDPLQRRGAYYALGTNEKNEFEKKLDDVVGDSSEYVRMVLPAVYMNMSSTWLHYLDRKHFDSQHIYSSSSMYGRRELLAPEVKEALFNLTADKSPKIRLESFICLLSNKVPIDLAQLIETIDAFPDRETIERRIGDYVVNNYRELGDPFKVLLPYLEGSRHSEETLAKVRKHFKIDDEGSDEPVDFVYRKAKKAVPAAFMDAPEAPPETEVKTLKAVYFTSAGCSDCARVDNMLADLQKHFPMLEIEKRDIKKVASMRLNEALSERFGVPHKVRLVTPAVFAGGGFLVKKEISFARLGELLSKSSVIPLESWYEVDEEALQEAEDAIGNRYSAMGMGLVFFAGLLDGVNPCAFATIIFLLSYLQVTRRTPREVLQVGGAFILAVFLSYFVLGFGLVEVITRMSILQQFGKMVTWAMAGLALIIMGLSLRDGVLCMRGQMEDMSLQLPEFLKERIRGVIRKGARHSRFVIAAFVAGVVISFLELACTGQVYAPTILFMLKTGEDTVGASLYLLVYNLAFVMPLVVVFAFAYGGLRSEALTAVMRKHAAAVKFSTAALFLVLFVVLIFGDKLLTML